MRIAINCRSCANKGGIGRYSRALIRELIDRFKNHHFLLFSPMETDLAFIDPAFIDKKSNWEKIPVSGSSNRPLWETFNLTNAVNHSEPDIFHNPDYTVPSGIKAPSTVTVHDLSFKFYPIGVSLKARTLYNLLTPQSVRKAKLVMADSQSTKREIIRAGWKSAEFIRVVYLAVDDNFLTEINPEESVSVLREFNLEAGYILYLGAIDKRKNITDIVKAYSELSGTQTGIPPLVLAGEDIGGASEVTDLILKLKLGNKIRRIGFVEPSKLKAVYSNAKMFVFPSHYEGFGLPPLEAMACGVPTIVSDSTSLPEVVGDSGLIVPLNDVKKLAESMLQLVTDKDLHHKLSVNGRKRASSFTWDKVSDNVMRVYEEIAGAK
jgi:glycosyltransferase involved in cell wall biosynthesis